MTTHTGAESRFSAIRNVNKRTPRKFDPAKDERGNRLRISEYFGVNTFDLRRMRESLPSDVFNKLVSTIHTGRKLDLDVADTVAQAVKQWALTNGVTHFCHWFQPQTGATAEKHDSFLTFDENRKPIEKFSASMLISSEPDASSFPSGGMRTTFEARGYTAWDPSSPIFIMESTNGKTLCIPSAFISYHGDALDEKTVLLRSMEVLNTKAVELLHLMGDTKAQRVVPTLGAEQEFFLIDREFFSLRPDLVMAGRTLIGAQPPRGQQMEDHYFGSVPSRVLACMSELEYEMYKMGVPVKTRHNEVAPSQFEVAPIFEEVNVASDHNQLLMDTLKKVARRHNYEVIFHEKPFAGLNGSGKHCNWAMALMNDTNGSGENLLEPGRTPHQNVRFLMFLAATLNGVHKHAGLLRAAIASPGNDHRLGANEAPPAIISAFLGDTLTRILNELEKESNSEIESNTELAVLKLGVDKLPDIPKDNTDRNRTSPFAFTGNKFEFRAVGSSASTAFPMTLLNAAVADSMDEIAGMLKERMATVKDRNAAILEVIRDVVKATKAVRFEGDNYSDAWVKEAEGRGLLNLRKSSEALKQLLKKDAVEMLSRTKVFKERELQARYNVRLERYIKQLMIEVDTLRSMVDTQIFPAAFAYYTDLATGVQTAKAAGLEAPMADMAKEVGALISELRTKRNTLETKMAALEKIMHEEEKAGDYLATDVSDAMAAVRSVCDRLEMVVADDFWPLPKYREMLFL